jgi:8-oxo-dGTP pyrophosphatase MutT (NUDIX family)
VNHEGANAASPAPATSGATLRTVAHRAVSELSRASSVAVEETVRARYVDLLSRDPSALLREGGDGSGDELPGVHLTASAFVLDAGAAHTALVWHRKGRCWVQPGGHVEPDDPTLLSSVLREVREETGLSGCTCVGPGPALLQPHDTASTFGHCTGHLDVVFVLRAPGRARDLPLIPETPAGATRWVSWPRTGTGAFCPDPGLPGDMRPADDLSSLTAALAPYLDRYADEVT